MDPIKVLFLGTSEFSKNCLEKIILNPQFKIQAVFTKPDAFSGRGLKKRPSSVKKWAAEQKIPVFTPYTFKDPANLKFILKFDIDIVIMISYGFIIPLYFLKWFPDRILNVHASLLPRWRGAAPVPHCLLAGDSVTGLTLQKTVLKLDAGDIIHKISIPILQNMDSIDIYQQMEKCVPELLFSAIPRYLTGKIKLLPQNEKLATYAPKIQKSQLKVNWGESALKILNSIRAFSSESGVFTFFQGKRFKIFRAEISLESGNRGEILGYNKKGLLTACGQGALYLKVVQLEGKKKQKIEEFMKGYPLKKGEKFE